MLRPAANCFLNWALLTPVRTFPSFCSSEDRTAPVGSGVSLALAFLTLIRSCIGPPQSVPNWLRGSAQWVLVVPTDDPSALER